jgi:cysteine desulfurase/selenocysteine lyase
VTPVLGSRDLFPDLDVPHYLNAASVSPLSKPVTEAMMASLMHQARGGVSAVEHFSASVEGVRSAFGTLVGAASADVAVLANTSAGVTAVASCLDWRPGDRVLLFSGDFPTNITPWQQAAKRYELELVWMDGDRFRTDIGGILDDIEREISRGLRLIAVSAVSFVTGRRRPVEHLARRCRAADTELFVDAIQALGVSPLRMDCGIDYMAAGGHKWLGGPFGTGVMAVAPRRWSQLGGTVASWLSHPEPLGFLFGDRGLLAHDKPLVRGPAVLEGGAFNGVGAAGLSTSIGLLNALGVEAIGEHVDGLNQVLADGLRSRGWEVLWSEDRRFRAGAVVVDPKDKHAGDIVVGLAERGVCAASPNGHLRFAPHWHANLGDIQAALSALDEVVAAH